MNNSKTFSQRLTEDLTPILESVLFFQGLHLEALEMSPVENDEEVETIFGGQFVFTLRARAIFCNPKGNAQSSNPQGQ